MTAQASITARDIAWPLIHEPTEINRSNTALACAIEKIKALPGLANEKTKWIGHLQGRINSNNRYVQKRLAESPNFSLVFCAKMRDLEGAKYLMRTGEDPNLLVGGRNALHIAVANTATDMVGVLMAYPRTDPSVETKNHHTAFDLTEDPRILQLLERS